MLKFHLQLFRIAACYKKLFKIQMHQIDALKDTDVLLHKWENTDGNFYNLFVEALNLAEKLSII